MESSCHSGTVASNASTDAIHPAEDGRLSSARVALLAVCCAASVANVYYAQPLLDSIARDFGVSQAAVGGVITATQLGCALALLFVVPLGDLLNRKRLIAVQLVLLSAACIGVATAPTRGTLLAGMVAVGLLGTAMTQGLIACSAALAGAGERGRVVGAAQGGVVVGLLAARSLAGVVTDIAGGGPSISCRVRSRSRYSSCCRGCCPIGANRAHASATRRCCARWCRCCATNACCVCAARSHC